MEGYTTETPASSEKKDKDDDKPEKKKKKAVDLGGRTFELASKKDTKEEVAKEIAESSSIWEKLIPKDGKDKPQEIAPPVAPDRVESVPDVEKPPAVEDVEELNDPSVENLLPGEKAEVVKDYTQERTAELEAELSETEDPAQVAEIEADLAFLKQTEQVAEATPLEAVEENTEVAVEFPIESETVATTELAATEPDDSPAEFGHDEAIELNPSTPAAEVADTHDDSVQLPARPIIRQSVPSSPNTTSGNSGNGNQPPAIPNAPPSGPNNPGGSNLPPTPPVGPNFNAAPPSGYNPNVAPGPTRVEYVRDTRNEGAYFLAGGILGYLLGRRRGRIKTEKRMNVVKKKLEKQIDQVRQEVIRQETVIRAQARERYNETRGADSLAAGTEAPARRSESNHPGSRPESITKRRPSAEAVAAAEQVRRMDHREVVAMAEKVVIDGTSLRTIYEAKQITEPGLRRITSEYLSGGDIRAALQQEIQVKEMQYERDPQMRDRLAASYADVDAAQPQASHEAMAALIANTADPAKTPRRDTSEKEDAKADAAKERGKKVLVSVWAVLVFVLVIVAIVLASR